MRRFMRRTSAIMASMALVGCAHGGTHDDPRTPDAPGSWTDGAGNRNVRVAVGGTFIHYIDYGGSGEPLVFLAGLGNSAHVFDDFAPRFTDRYHVLAMTRRGYGESGRPADGYGTQRLVHDVRELLDSLKLQRAVLVGHSVAGDELTDFAVRYAERVTGLVYLDAAYDRKGVTGRLLQRMMLDQLPPRAPRPNARERESATAYAGFLARIYGVPWPAGEVRATRTFDADGKYVGDATPARINFAVARGETEMAYERVTAPALAFYAVDRSVERDYPWIRTMTIGRGNAQLQAEKARRAERRWEEDGRRHFRRAVPQARVVELRDASHYLFISHADTVEREMRSFLAGRERHASRKESLVSEHDERGTDRRSKSRALHQHVSLSVGSGLAVES